MSFVYKWAAAKMLPSVVTVGAEDPYFEEIPEAELGNSKKKKKKRKKAIPEGLSANDTKILKKFRKKAYRLDLCFRCCCGIRLGWAGIIGLVPWVGDILAYAMALSLVKSVRHIDGGMPPEIYSKMLANIMFDFLIGLIPIVGDLINIAYKCNSRNSLILEHYLIKKNLHNNGLHKPDEPAMSTLPTHQIYGSHLQQSKPDLAQQAHAHQTQQRQQHQPTTNPPLYGANTGTAYTAKQP